MKNLREQCVELTEENFSLLKSKFYANGKPKKIGDLVLWAMVTTDAEDDNEPYRLLPINYCDLNTEYKFIGYFEKDKSELDFNFPIVEGKYSPVMFGDLKEFNSYMRKINKK